MREVRKEGETGEASTYTARQHLVKYPLLSTKVGKNESVDSDFLSRSVDSTEFGRRITYWK